LKNKAQEIWGELKSVLSGATIDALLPPILFAVVNAMFGLMPAAIAAFVLAIVLGILRLIRGQRWYYALGGLIGVGIAAGLALISQNEAFYFIPTLISSGLLLLVALVTNLVGKPMAAWVSHLTRSWPLDWFWRDDVKSAYREVTWLWVVFFAMRLFIQIYLFRQGEVSQFAWANTLLGWPVTIVVLIISYVYGIWRLRKLGGPGVEEFQQGKEPPWKGQTKGF
jgi:hypothetical protein